MLPLQRPTPQPQAPQTPVVWSAISVVPRVTSSYSAEGATAAALDYVEEEEEEISFYEFHACHIQVEGASQQAGDSSQ